MYILEFLNRSILKITPKVIFYFWVYSGFVMDCNELKIKEIRIFLKNHRRSFQPPHTVNLLNNSRINTYIF